MPDDDFTEEERSRRRDEVICRMAKPMRMFWSWF